MTNDPAQEGRVSASIVCPTCGREQDRARRLSEEASCVASHRVREAFIWVMLGFGIAHLWLDEGVYAATVKRDDPITDAEALSWLERCHQRDVRIRPLVEGAEIEFDIWGWL